ncbi:MAG: SCO family protein [Candidatus Omnitrophica bacterium]|nr:SCO family protein [Candidatus Omnitrophota bacterium]MBI3008459.1 SCO family protein [Candidatus Omnitrophota bacterium]
MKTMSKTAFLFLLIMLINSGSFPEGHGSPPEIGIDERLGEYVPLTLSFQDEDGETVSLRQIISRPTVLSLVYYRCPGICNPLLSGLAEVLGKLQLEMGRDYNVLTVSFDPQDTPAIAIEKKKNYLTILKKEHAKESWRFLTGDPENIKKLTVAVGFKFKKEGDEFVHPAALIILSPDGKVIRYLYGITFLPFDVNMAFVEASKGRVGPSIRRALLFCYKYDPKGRKYGLNIMRLAGTAITFFAITFFAYLTITGRRKQVK